MSRSASRRTSNLLSAAGVGAVVLFGAIAMALVGRSPGAPVLLPPNSVLARFDLEGGDGRVRHGLPGRLREISGLARTESGILLGHDDERARIHRLDSDTGEVFGEFRLGKNGLRGDFEGIAVATDQVFLTDSDGTVLVFTQGDPETQVPYRTLDTGVGKRCEVEGLALQSGQGRLLLACKSRRDRELRGGLTIFTVDPDRADGAPAVFVDLAPETLSAKGLPRRLSLSGIEVHEETGHLILIAGREGRIVEIEPSGKIVAWARLRSGPHPQPEGVTFTADGNLVIADEASGSSARLTVYRRQEAAVDSIP